MCVVRQRTPSAADISNAVRGKKKLLGDVYIYVASGSALKLDPDGLWSDFWFFGAKLSLGLMPCKRGREECHCSAGWFVPYIIDWLYILCVIVRILLVLPRRLLLSISEYCRQRRCLSFFNGRLFIGRALNVRCRFRYSFVSCRAERKIYQ